METLKNPEIFQHLQPLSAGQFSVEIGYGGGDQLQIEGRRKYFAPISETYVKDEHRKN